MNSANLTGKVGFLGSWGRRIGFDVQKDREARRQLMEIARMGGGEYFQLSNARQLAAALREAVRPAEYEVLDSTSRRVVLRGRVNGDPVEVEPGRYQVRLVGADTEPASVELAAGQSLELSLDESGGLVIPAEGRREAQPGRSQSEEKRALHHSAFSQAVRCATLPES